MTDKRKLTPLEDHYLDAMSAQGQQFGQGLAAEKQRFEQLGNKTLKAMEDVIWPKQRQKKHSMWGFVKHLFSKQ